MFATVLELPKYQPLTRVSQIPVEPFMDLSFLPFLRRLYEDRPCKIFVCYTLSLHFFSYVVCGLRDNFG